MLKEALEYLQGLSRPGVEVRKINGLEYAITNAEDGDYNLVTPPQRLGIKLATLSGLVALIKTGVEGMAESDLSKKYYLHVTGHKTVQLAERKADEYGRCLILAQAEADVHQPFAFGHFHRQEEFLIGLSSGFENNPDLVDLLSVASKMTAQQSVEAQDDGISQKVQVSKGALKTEVTAKPRVQLQPFRTFSEVPQPASEFIFRVRAQENAAPLCALFEADGGAWKADAMDEIRAWLADRTTVPVIA